MERREFLKQSAAGMAAGGALMAGCAPASTGGGAAAPSGKQVIWRLASSFPPGLDTIYGASEVCADRVAEMTGGRFQIRVFAAGEIVPGLQVMDAVQSGSVQVGHTAGYYYIGKNPALAFDTTVPFGLTARQQMAWLYHGGGLELMREVYSDFGVINFPGGNTGVQMGGWFREPIGSAADMQGLKMRIPGMGGKVMDRLGVSVQVLSGGEIYPALETGAIDAAEWVGPYDDEKLGFHKVANNCYYPGWWEPGPSLSFLVNRSAWDGLPAAYQAVFQAACAEASQNMMTMYDKRNPEALKRLTEAGVSFRAFSDDVMKNANDLSRAMLEEQSAADASYRKIYESWTRFREDAMEWFGLAEYAYLRHAACGGRPVGSNSDMSRRSARRRIRPVVVSTATRRTGSCADRLKPSVVRAG